MPLAGRGDDRDLVVCALEADVLSADVVDHDGVERHPVNDYAHFCLGRSYEKTGRTMEARRHAALAAHMRPDRKDYQAFRNRLRAA